MTELSDFSINFFSLKGKTAFVTGANTGLGQAHAVALAKAGADLFMVTHGKEWAETEKLITNEGVKVSFFQADLTKREEVTASVNKCMEEYGKIDILINNAGTLRRTPLLEYKDEDWQAVLDLNLSAVYYLSQEVAKIMVKQGGGKIINIASLLSFQGGESAPAYAASKHGVAGTY